MSSGTGSTIYAQFKSKEDILLALIEGRSNCRRARVEKIPAKSPTAEGNIAALRDLYLERIVDQAWSLLFWSSNFLQCGIPNRRSSFSAYMLE
jgi:AcrR family transcriptional regulator